MKHFKKFYEAQTASRYNEITQPTLPHEIKFSYVSGTKIFLLRVTRIYRHLLSKCFENPVLERLELVECKCFF